MCRWMGCNFTIGLPAIGEAFSFAVIGRGQRTLKKLLAESALLVISYSIQRVSDCLTLLDLRFTLRAVSSQWGCVSRE